MPVSTPHGSWPSPVTAAHVAAHDGRPNWVGFVGRELWWTQPTPLDGGRVRILRRRPDGTVAEALPPGFSARSRCHEYGGRPWAATVGQDGPVLVFAAWADQRLHRYEPDRPDAVPLPLTPEPDFEAGLRYVDPFPHPDRAEVWCVREQFHSPDPTDLTRALVAVPQDGSAASDGQAVRVLTQSHHFLANPRLAPDGRHLLWLGWNHPSMPWDQTELCVAEVLGDGTLGAARVLAGGAGVSVSQAEWLDAGSVLYAADPDGWWRPYRRGLAGGEAEPLADGPEEFAGPLWHHGMRWLAPVGAGRFASIHGRSSNRLSILSTEPGTAPLVPDAEGYTEWASTLAVSGPLLAAVAAGPARPYDVLTIDTDTGEVTVVHEGARTVDPDYLPEPRHRTFTGRDDREIHTNLYPPRNPGHVGPPGELPPYLVFVHGGPTSRCQMIYDLDIAYFTSRGIGVVEVDYGGSTGHGREYRERLREQWGVVDVEDCADVARALAEAGLADPARLAIRGGSAGGWTTAASLVSAPDLYRCGTISYPILDLAAWRTGETHDFESQYLDSLIGPWPETADRYRDRSPVAHAEAITRPFLLLQGLDDRICPPAQCERFLERIRGRGIPHAYLAFEGEQHGFRKDSTIITALEAELAFYGEVMGFATPGVAPIELVR